MESLRKVYGKHNICIVFAVLVMLMIVGSFADYAFSQAVYNQQNAFGIALAAFGEMPALLAVLISGIFLIIGRNKDKKGTAIAQLVGGILLVALGTFIGIFIPTVHISNTIMAALIGLLLVTATAYFAIRITKSAEREMLIKVAIIFILAALGNMIIINIIKIPWGRPRMRLISEEVEAVFQGWWVVGSSAKTKLIEAGISSDEFKSFPSGHTANAAVAMCLPLFALLTDKLKGKETMLFIIGAAWGVLVALSRIIMGAHFITDTTIGFAATYAIILISVYYVLFKGKKKNSGLED